MKVIWCYQFDSPIGFEFDYQGIFCESKNDLLFFFTRSQPNYGKVNYIRINKNGAASVERISVPSKIGIPNSWVLENKTREYLIFEKCCLNLSTLSFCNNIPQSFSNQYKYRTHDWGMHLIEDDFVFGEYVISHRGEWGYECKKNGIPIWSFKGQGYLYTDIVRHGDTIFWGTAGQGGHFYMLHLASGSVLCDINTHGTTQFIKNDSIVYLLVSGKRGQVAAISLDTGRIVDSTDLPARVSSSSRIHLWNDKLYVIAFRKTKDKSEGATLFCVDF